VTAGASLVVELVYLVEKGTFSRANVEVFYDIINAADSGFEVVPVTYDRRFRQVAVLETI
jgi:hypothetical protein